MMTTFKVLDEKGSSYFDAKGERFNKWFAITRDGMWWCATHLSSGIAIQRVMTRTRAVRLAEWLTERKLFFKKPLKDLRYLAKNRAIAKKYMDK